MLEMIIVLTVFGALAILLFVIYIALIVMAVEALFVPLFDVPPKVPSQKKMRNVIMAEIHKNFPDAKTIIDIGSGWGGMAMRAAREFPHADAVGIELMPLPFCCATVSRCLLGPKNCRFAFGNAVRFIKDKKFDIAVCYSGPELMKAIEPHRDNFKVVLSIDFPLPNIAPSRTVTLHKDRMGQHVLYVYEALGTRR
ncbi:MAG: class I SAM-dependent methyltransferase [Alphaproteobacteria bacterium]|nr:class I SAM-dependent methyltransferase [Alphaproteobacteria bacterium]MCL2758207.1 class I SAM-dependent methyltransferase [Alphaproteobacteria bacterium]